MAWPDATQAANAVPAASSNATTGDAARRTHASGAGRRAPVAIQLTTMHHRCRLHQQAADADLHVESRGELPSPARPSSKLYGPHEAQQYADQ